MIENTTTTNTNYLAGGFQYKNNVLQFFPQAEGYVKNTSGAYSYVFNYTDHLGNVRVSYSDIDKNGILGNERNIGDCRIETDRKGNPSTVCDIYITSAILEESHYYPFGLKHEGYNSNNQQPNYNYKYNGKELQTELDLNTYAYGWRDYDPAIGRFNKMDRFSEKYYDKTQYGYAGNNPVLFVDVQGDSLSVANTQISKDYLNSAVNKSNQKYIKYDEKGNVSLDFGKVSDKAQKRLLKQDEGLAVINNMINATDVDGNSEKYYFEASNNREGIDGQGNEFSMEVTTVEGNSVSGLETTGYSWFANYSTTKYNDTVEHVTPKKGVDGAVFISPGTIYEYNNANIVIPMGDMIKHELRENYFRTHDKKGYNEAHKEAGGVSSFAKFKFD